MSGPARCGTAAGYRDDLCRCAPCKTAIAKEHNVYKMRRAANGGRPLMVPKLGSVRRLQALMALGWPRRELARQAGYKGDAFALILNGERSSLTLATARRVDDLFNRLSMTHGPSDKTRTYAAKAGWPPPLAFDDIDDPNEVPIMDASFTRWDSLETRFWGQVEKTEACWLWTGKLTSKGYGARIGHSRRSYYPHQMSYILNVGPIPDGLVLDHLCRVRRCVNPEHLEPVTSTENTQRGVVARWTEPCPNGHEPSARRALPSGKNICTECRRESDRVRYERDGDRRREATRVRRIKQRQEVLLELDSRLAGITTACNEIGVSRSALEKWCARHDLTPLYSRLVDREAMRYWANGVAEGGVA